MLPQKIFPQPEPIDKALARIELPKAPGELCKELDALTADRHDHDFVADRGAQKARECWIACQFLMAYGKRTERKYEVVSLMLEEAAPDIRYRDVEHPRTLLTIEATLLLGPDERPDEEFRKEKQAYETCQQKGERYQRSLKVMPNHKEAFPAVADARLKDKLTRDHGSNCTLVLYNNMAVDDQTILEFTASYKLPEQVKLQGIWFLCGPRADVIIPLVAAPAEGTVTTCPYACSILSC